MNCPVCEQGRSRPKLKKGQVEILECADCRLAWWNPEPGFDALDTYDAAYFGSAQHSHGYDDYASLSDCLRKTFAFRLSSIRPPQPEARLLDVGAAYGFAVDEACKAGWQAFGLEVSKAATSSAEGQALGRMVVGPGDPAPFASSSFQAVTAWDVLEHVSQPRELVRELHRLLEPGGRLVMTTGDVGSWLARVSGPRWHLYTLPEHLFFFSRRSIEVLLETEGFALEEIRSEGAYYTLGYLVERLRKTLLGRETGASGRWPGSQLAVPVSLFDIVRVSARRI